MLKGIGSRFLPALLVILLCGSYGLAQTEKKVASGILIDNTASLITQSDDVVLLGEGIAELSYRRGPVAVFNFKPSKEKKEKLTVVPPGVEWSQDKNLIDAYLDSLSVARGETTLMDAIYAIAEQLNAKVDQDKDAFGDKLIYLVTDGEDRGSKIKEKQLIKLLKESGIKVYAIGLVKELNAEQGPVSLSRREKATKFLETLAVETGGRAVFSKSKKDNVISLLNALFAK